ncbi:MAG: phospholipase D-like domain-containing protein [Propionibacteriaceae bacterium]|nr:phospholipase D-like domain-containing protein [Propionibacteriaceae bacterium]
MRLQRLLSGALAVLTATLIAVTSAVPAHAIDFTIDAATGKPVLVSKSSCTTLASKPRAFEAWFNTDDMEERGYLDAKNDTPWPYATKIAQVICGAKKGATIKIAMYFVRAIGSKSRPESDPEQIWGALEYVARKRGVKVTLIYDDATPAAAERNITKRAKGWMKVRKCYEGCFNLNTTDAASNSLSINHEKFMTISSTIWGGPIVYSSSGMFARSQIRAYWQESSLLFGDKQLYKLMKDRFDNMYICATSRVRCSKGDFVNTAYKGRTSLRLERGIWVDKKYRHYTDAGRGTTVSFSPQPQTAPEFYVQQLSNVDCTVDSKIRIAMYHLTGSRAETFVKRLRELKRAGCDVRVVLSPEAGAVVIEKSVVKLIKKYGLTNRVLCGVNPIHTKLVLITPATSNAGVAMFGTMNMSTAGMRYSDEHTITIDTRRMSAKYKEDAERVIGVYAQGWDAMSQGAKKCVA